jgi:PKHD-type hydroxylase
MHYSWEEGLHPEQCDKVVQEWKLIPTEEASILDTNEVDEKIRKARICWVDDKSLVYRAVSSFMQEANGCYFRYNITSLEKAQFATYEEGCFYDWHPDSGVFSPNEEKVRKLSCVIQLTDPKDYEGGELELYNGTNPPVKPSNKQGSVVVFNSSIYHRVTPVTKGTRYSLVMWASGPNFT